MTSQQNCCSMTQESTEAEKSEDLCWLTERHFPDTLKPILPGLSHKLDAVYRYVLTNDLIIM